MQKFEIDEMREQVKKLYEKDGNKRWKEASKEERDKIIEYMVDGTAYEWDKLNSLSEEGKRWTNQGVLIIVGVFIGIAGGLVSNIIDSYLKRFGVLYDVIAFVVFIFLIWFIIIFIKSVNPEAENEYYKILLKEAHRINKGADKRV